VIRPVAELALATMLKLRDEGDALPVAAALFSPLTGLDRQPGLAPAE